VAGRCGADLAGAAGATPTKRGGGTSGVAVRPAREGMRRRTAAQRPTAREGTTRDAPAEASEVYGTKARNVREGRLLEGESLTCGPQRG
jgi:hypothetical protein